MSQEQTAEQRVAACLQLSPEGAGMLDIVLREKLPEDADQQRWRKFDTFFQQCCIKEATGNLVLNEEAFAEITEPDPEALINSGVGIYNGCVKALAGLEGHDIRVFKCLTQIYLSAKMALKFKS